MEIEQFIKALGEPMRFRIFSGIVGKKALCALSFKKI